MRRRCMLIALSLLVVISIVMVFAFRDRDLHHPACAYCDAYLYGVEAKDLSVKGFGARLASGGVRTIGYPAFLVAVMDLKSAGPDNQFAYSSHRVATAQTLLFVVAVLTLFAVLYQHSVPVAWSAAIGLLANPYVLQYLPLRMTEGLTAPLVVAVVTLAAALCILQLKPWQEAALLGLCGAIAGVAMIVRPANVVVVAAFVVFLMLYLYLKRGARFEYGVVGVAAPLLLQSILNLGAYGRFTPFPAADLGSFQTNAGLSAIKYFTDMAGETVKGARYVNPFFSQADISAYGAYVYVYRPAAGILTLLAHAFASIDHDHFFTYVARRAGTAERVVNFLAHFSISVAAATAAILAVRIRPALDRIAPLWMLLIAIVVFTLCLNSLTLPETRFGLLVYMIVGPTFVYGIWQLRCRSSLIAFGASYAVLAVALSAWMQSQLQ